MLRQVILYIVELGDLVSAKLIHLKTLIRVYVNRFESYLIIIRTVGDTTEPTEWSSKPLNKNTSLKTYAKLVSIFASRNRWKRKVQRSAFEKRIK